MSDQEMQKGSASPSGKGETIGVLGLGIIGSAWAKNYEADGVLGASFNRSPRPGAPRVVSDPKSVAEAASVLHIVVSDPNAVKNVLDGLEPALSSWHLVIQSTTIDPDSAEQFAERVLSHGASYLEAPFMGSRPAAEQRKTVFMLGGSDAAVERARPLLSRVSSSMTHVGSVRQAAALKLSFNVQVAGIMSAQCESLHAARRAGLSDSVFFDILRTTALWSPFHTLKEPKLSQGDFSPQFSVKHMLKDVRLALSMMESSGDAPLPVSAQIKRQLEKAAEEGFLEEDMAALIKVL